MNDFLIIGADAAGLSAAVQIRRKRTQAGLKVINKGRTISYGACGIPYVISGDVAAPDKLIHYTPETMEKERGIKVEILREAVGIDPEAKYVEVKNLETGEVNRETYGRLLIATGATPRRLPFLDYAAEGVFHLHDMDDLGRILAFMNEKRPRTAAVIGAGNIGLELAEALRARDMNVVMIDILETPIATWPSLVREAVLREMRSRGVRFAGGAKIEETVRRGSGFALRSNKGDFEADVIFSVVGVRPAVEFCGGKIKALENGALLTDAFCRTSAADVYAAGDCAAVHHRILDRPVWMPLGSTANKAGRVAGINMAGGSVAYPGIVGTQVFKYFGLSLARTGVDAEEAAAAGLDAFTVSSAARDKPGYYPGAGTVEIEIVCEKESGRLLGAAVVSPDNAVIIIDAAAVAITAGMTIRDLAWLDAAYTPPFAPVWNALSLAALKALRL